MQEAPLARFARQDFIRLHILGMEGCLNLHRFDLSKGCPNGWFWVCLVYLPAAFFISYVVVLSLSVLSYSQPL